MLSFPSDDEVGGLNGTIRASDVRAADLQEEPTKRPENRASCPTRSFHRIRRRRRLPGEHRSEQSEPLNGASTIERSNQTQRKLRSREGRMGALRR
jgi:hypothetical protein